jgi:hypothetical protein
MDLLPLSAFNELLEFRGDRCISMFMPTARAGKDVEQNPIRFKNLLQDIEGQLEDQGMGKMDLEKFLQPLKNLTRDDTFWRKQASGLAVFYHADELLAYRLPLDFDEQVFISDRYYVRPLIPMFVENENFYLLILDLSNMRLLGGTRYPVSEIDPGDTPRDMNEVLVYEDPEKRLEFHNTSSPSQKGHKGVFNEHHPEEEEKKDIRRFFHKVDQGVMDVIGDERAPLILIGAEHLLPIYEEVNSYPRLLEGIKQGNPNVLHPQELHQQAWKVMEPVLEEEIQDVIDSYHTLLVRDQAAHKIEEIVPAAYHGLVDTLLTAKGEHSWGRYDPESNTYQRRNPEDTHSRELVGFAAAHTLMNGGVVYNLAQQKMPEKAEKAAFIKRY